jgi:hypothetical protein
MKLLETSLPAMWSKGLAEEKAYDIAPEFITRMTETLFRGVAGVLAANREPNRPVAFIIDRLDGKVVACAVLQLFENEDKKNPGNWNLFFSFDEADIPKDAKRIYLKDPLCQSFFVAPAANKCNMEFKSEAALVILMTYVLEQIYKWLDENAKADEEVSIEQEGVFQARVGVENGQKVFSIEPAGEIKMLIKNDTSIEK